MGNPDGQEREDFGPPAPGEAEIQRLRAAKNMRLRNIESYSNSFSDPSVIDPKTSPYLNKLRRIYLRAYDKLLQKFTHAFTILLAKKEEREQSGIGFLFPLPDPVVTKDDFLRTMRTISGEGCYEGYERALQYEQRTGGLRSEEGLIIGNEEGW